MTDKNSSGYEIALHSFRQIINILLIICLAVGLIFVGSRAYAFGYAVFHYKPVEAVAAEEDAIPVVIHEDDTVYDIGRRLDDKGLISEGPFVFVAQEWLSDYHGKIKPGEYKLTKAMSADEMLHILSGAAGEDEETNSQNDS